MHSCALREGQTRREAEAQSLGASYLASWEEVAGLPNRAAGQQCSAFQRGERMRPNTIDIFHATQSYQACLLRACSMEQATSLNKKKWS